MDARPIQIEYLYPTAFAGWGREEIEAINRVVASDKYTMGAEVDAFEHEFAAYHGMRHCIMVNSGSSANLISVAAMCEHGLERGDEVAVPALAWSTTYSPLVQYGLKLRLLDCGDSWNCEAIPVGFSKLVVVCPILGNPTSPLFVSAGHSFMVLEDNCESIGARRETGHLCGTRGLANTFSFYWSHQLSAVEGGAILTDDADFARTCRLLRSHGWTRWLRHLETFEDEFEFVAFGYNVRPLELHAAIARVQLKKLDARIAQRNFNYRYWQRVSDGLPIVHPMIHGSPSLFGIHFQVASREVRSRLATALRASGIDCRPPVAGSFRRQPYGARWKDQQTPNADRIHDCGMMIGNAPFPIPDLIDRAVDVLRKTL